MKVKPIDLEASFVFYLFRQWQRTKLDAIVADAKRGQTLGSASPGTKPQPPCRAESVKIRVAF